MDGFGVEHCWWYYIHIHVVTPQACDALALGFSPPPPPKKKNKEKKNIVTASCGLLLRLT